MGCTSSKLDDLPAVALCRDRCTFLDEAIHQRYALAQAHLAYFHSLKTIGLSLHRFFHPDLLHSLPPSPLLNLPTHRKGDPQPSASPPPTIHHHHHSHSNSNSNSNSGSHLHFNSDSGDDDEEEDGDDTASDNLHHHSDDRSPSHSPYAHLNYMDHETLASYGEGGGFIHMNYMRNKATPSVLYEQRPISPEILQVGDSSSYYPYPYNNNNNLIPSTHPPYYNNYSNYGGFFGSAPPSQLPVAAASVASSSKQPPPPPSLPRGSTWDFLNPFESFEKYFPPYTPSRDSKEVREEEGIPDLEDEDYQHEVVKEVHGNQKFVDDGGGGGDNYSKAAVVDEEEEEGKGEGNTNDAELHYRTTRPSVSMVDDAVEYEVHMVDKKVVDKDDKSGNHCPNAATFKGFCDDSEVMKEIQAQFERASESGSELTKMLEIGKQPHNRKHAAYQAVSSIAPSILVVSSQSSTSKSTESSSIEKADPAYLDINDHMGLRSGNLSSTLQKLFLWEKKLYEEVKVEEKMRVLHERKCRKLRRLDERGAEAHKVDMTRILVRSLSTKIRIAIQVVDKISEKINKLRDDELWPQLNEFIQGLTRMWKSMLACHRSQCQAIGEARRLDAITSHKHFSDAHLEATIQLEHGLLNWVFSFSCWVGAQKGYVKALNNWLLKCLLYVPEETPDGIAPFSPSRIGAPTVFVICNQWSQGLEIISEKEVVEAMRDFAASVLQLWEWDKLEMQKRMMANREMEKKVKNLEREDQKIQKEIQALDKRIVLVSGDGDCISVTGQMVYHSETSKNTSFQVGMQRIFEAMEKFTASSLRTYEELLQRIEELRLAEEQGKVS